MSEQRDHYLVFPIWLLRHGCHPDTVTPEQANRRLWAIAWYCLQDAAGSLYGHLPAQDQLFAAARTVGLLTYANWSPDSVRNARDEIHKLRLSTPDQQTGKKLCRMRLDYFLTYAQGSRSHKRTAWREFAVLTSVLAVCFDKRSAVKATNEQLAAMAIGYGSQSQARAADQSAALLASHQIRHTRNALAKRKLFQHCAKQRGQYFSVGKTPEQLATYVAAVGVLAKKKRAEAAKRVQTKTADQQLADLKARFPDKKTSH